MTCESSRRGDFFASVLFFRLLQVALMRERVRGGDELSPHLSALRAGRSWPLPQIFAASAQLAWDDRTGLKGHA